MSAPARVSPPSLFRSIEEDDEDPAAGGEDGAAAVVDGVVVIDCAVNVDGEEAAPASSSEAAADGEAVAETAEENAEELAEETVELAPAAGEENEAPGAGDDTSPRKSRTGSVGSRRSSNASDGGKKFAYVYTLVVEKATGPVRRTGGGARVVCYLCGREAGTASIRFHHLKCIERWPPGDPLPFPPSYGAIPKRRGRALTAYNDAARACYETHTRCSCPLCGKEGIKRAMLNVHLRDECVNAIQSKRAVTTRAESLDPHYANMPAVDLDGGGAARIPLPPNPRLRPDPKAVACCYRTAPREPESASQSRRRAAKDTKVLNLRRRALLLEQAGDDRAALYENKEAAQAEASLARTYDRSRHGLRPWCVGGTQYRY